MLKIYTLGEEVLRQKALPIEEVTEEIKTLAQEMFEAMEKKKGVGLAGPQVGKLLRIFIAVADDNVKRVFINPQIISTSQELSDYEEGCLSIPGVYETIRRPMRVTVQALNENGRAFTLEADGLLARIIQHEIDHLNGILFIDRGDEAFARKTETQFKRRAEKFEKKKLKKLGAKK
ncbi:MAG: peptide deformylase [Treponema sp.]|nr:peptide deformylase [Treponema sp.]